MARPTNALIVDDESHARTYVRLLLKEAGIDNVWEAGDGAQAMAMFAEHQPELVMLDVNLRMMTGLQLLQQMKQLRPEVPVIMLTSENALKTVHEAVRLGAVAYILKHSPKDKALESLEDALDVIEDGAEEEPAS
jgi:DNA-binding NtrC family response regulator